MCTVTILFDKPSWPSDCYHVGAALLLIARWLCRVISGGKFSVGRRLVPAPTDVYPTIIAPRAGAHGPGNAAVKLNQQS